MLQQVTVADLTLNKNHLKTRTIKPAATIKKHDRYSKGLMARNTVEVFKLQGTSNSHAREKNFKTERGKLQGSMSTHTYQKQN